MSCFEISRHLILHDRVMILYMSMYMYMHTSIHPYIYTSRHPDIQTYKHTNIQTCKHANMRACIHTCMHTCMHAYIHRYVHVPAKLVSVSRREAHDSEWCPAVEELRRGPSTGLGIRKAGDPQRIEAIRGMATLHDRESAWVEPVVLPILGFRLGRAPNPQSKNLR